MFLCELNMKPCTFEIKKEKAEIYAAKVIKHVTYLVMNLNQGWFQFKDLITGQLSCQWMPIEEYVNQPWNQEKELFRFMANICLKRSQEMEYMGFSTVRTTTSTGRESYLYCNTDHANLLNPTRGPPLTPLVEKPLFRTCFLFLCFMSIVQ